MAFENYKRRKLCFIGAQGSSVDDVSGVEVYHLIDPEPCNCGNDHGLYNGVGLVLVKHNDAGDCAEVAMVEFNGFHAAALSRILGAGADLAMVRDSEWTEADPEAVAELQRKLQQEHAAEHAEPTADGGD